MPALVTRRLDLELVSRSLADSRERAQALIAAGLVSVDGETARSSAQPVTPAAELAVRGHDHPWASRGGLKLDAALSHFGVDPGGRVCLDAGASTGGFTDVLLARGATLVYAVDVGRGQLHSRLAADPRVVVLDATNARHLTGVPGPRPTLLTLDLSFISLRTVLPSLAALCERPAEVVALFKPQFEVGRAAVGRGGIVRDAQATSAALEAFIEWASSALGAVVTGSPLPSPIRGAKGNQEHLLHLELPESAP